MSHPPPPPPEPLVKPSTIPGRGRALVATRTILPGEIILVDSPLLLYPPSLSSLSSFCSHCFRSLSLSSTPPIPCPSSPCPSLFCSPLCLSSHSPSLCHHLRLLPSDSSDSSLFLAAAHSLPPSSIPRLLSLHGSPDLLSIDRLNSFALMEPPSSHDDRKVRAYGIYPLAALFNHDCLPNACRFDYVDAPGTNNNTDIIVRAIHEVPEGREVCLSYFPVNWGYKERQRRLREDYGFVCECDRCLVERNWKDDDGEGEDEEMEMEMEMEGVDDGEEEDFPHAYFFERFMCDREGCGGTLAPLPPSGEGVLSDVMECNVCGKLRKEDDGDMVDDE